MPLAADIFFERNYFTKEQTERWLGAAVQHGLDIHIHSMNFQLCGGGQIKLQNWRGKIEQTATKKKNKKAES